eukprot:TRINITY_DN5180_c0_g2_i1.p1 TRINITY_DN5180_c0_g2~~TRINITY_DN5180_c0_g2_i1.p1  ORF type:complete len:2513 (-),score=545.73 TRINITY_DN5180_c0_g2_i1:91-7629(-)
MDTIELTINIVGNTHKMRFPTDATLKDVLKGIAEKYNKDEPDYGIFRPENNAKGRLAEWLVYGKPLNAYGFESEVLEYKKKWRVLKYRLIGDAVKAVMIDDASLVKDIIFRVADRENLKNVDEFGLRLPNDAQSWLEPDATLQQQKIGPDQELVFDRRFFGESLDLEDPFQLQLYYLQAKHAVMSGELIVNREEAIFFAALELQINNGNFVPSKYSKPGWLLRDKYLPPHWQKDKKIENEIADQYKKFSGITQTNAKYRFYSSISKVKSFGTTFFECGMYNESSKHKSGKITIPSKQKPKPILLGISRDEFIVLDSVTRERIHIWKFKHHKQFLVDKNVVLIDFGDHFPSQLLVTSNQADNIGRLITGYIDLIVKQTKNLYKTETPAEFLDMADLNAVSTNISLPLRIEGSTSNGGYYTGPNGNIIQPGSNQFQIQDFKSAKRAVAYLSSELGTTTLKWVNPSGLAMENVRSQFENDKKTLFATLDEFVNTAKVKEDLRNLLDVKAQQIAMHVKAMASRARSLDAFEETPVLFGAKAVADAVSDLFALLEKTRDDPNKRDEMIAGLAHAERAIESSKILLNWNVKAEGIVDEGTEKMVQDLIEDSRSHLQFLIQSGKQVTKSLPQEAASRLTSAVDTADLSSDWILNSMSSLAPVLGDINVAEQLKIKTSEILSISNSIMSQAKSSKKSDETLNNMIITAKALSDAMNNIVNATKMAEKRGLKGDIKFISTASSLVNSLSKFRTALSTPEKLLDSKQQEILPSQDLILETKFVMDIVSEQMTKAKQDKENKKETDFETVLNTVRDRVAKDSKLPTQLRDDSLTNHIKECTAAVKQVCSAVQIIASSPTLEESVVERLKKADEILSFELSHLQMAAEELRAEPNNEKLLNNVKSIVSSLEGKTQQLITDAGEMSSTSDLRYSVKVSISKSLALAGQTIHMHEELDDKKARDDLLKAVSKFKDGLKDLVSIVEDASRDPVKKENQKKLLTNAKKYVSTYSKFIKTNKSLLEQVKNPEKRVFLSNAISQMSDAKKALSSSIEAVAGIDGQFEIEAALEDIDAAKVYLETASFQASQGLLKSLPGQTREEALENLSEVTLKLKDDMLSFVTLAQENDSSLPKQIRSTAQTISNLATAARMVATVVVDRSSQKQIVEAAQSVYQEALNTISLGRVLAQDTKSKMYSENLKKSHHKMLESLDNLMKTAEQLQAKEVEEAIKVVAESLKTLDLKEPKITLNFTDTSNALVSDAKALSAAVAQFSASANTNTVTLGAGAKMIGFTTSQFILSCTEVAASSNDKAMKMEILEAARKLADSMQQLLKSSMEAAKKKETFKNNETTVKETIDSLLRTLGVSTSQAAEESISTINALIHNMNDEDEDFPSINRSNLVKLFISNGEAVLRLSESLSKANSGGKNIFPLSVLAKEAVAVVTQLLNVARAASKIAHNFTPQETRMLKICRLIEEDPINHKQVSLLTKELSAGILQLMRIADESSTNSNDKKSVSINNSIKRLRTSVNSLAKETGNLLERNVGKIGESAGDIKQKIYNLALSMKEENANDSLTTMVADQLKDAAKNVALSLTGQIRAAAAIVNYDNSDIITQELVKATNRVKVSLAELMQAIGPIHPGIIRCQKVYKLIQDYTLQYNVLTVKLSTEGTFTLPSTLRFNEKDRSTYQQQSITLCKNLAEDIQKVVGKSMSDDCNALDVEVARVESSVENITSNLLLTARSYEHDLEVQSSIIASSKGLMEALLALIDGCRSVNIFDKSYSNKLNALLNTTSKAIGELLNDLQSSSQLISDIEQAVQRIKKNLTQLLPPQTEKVQNSSPRRRNVQYFNDLSDAAKDLTEQSRKLLVTDKAQSGEIGIAVSNAVDSTSKVISAVNNAMTVVADNQTRESIKRTTSRAVSDLISIINLTSQIVQGNNKHQERNEVFKSLNMAITDTLKLVKGSDVIERSLQKADKQLLDIIQQLNTLIMYAQSGQLDSASGSGSQGSKTKKAQESEKLAKKMPELLKAVDKLNTKINSISDDEFTSLVSSITDQTSEIFMFSSNTAQQMPNEDKLSQLNILNSSKSFTAAIRQLLSTARDSKQDGSDSTKLKIFNSSYTVLKDCANDLVNTCQSEGNFGLLRVEKELDQLRQSILNMLKEGDALSQDPHATAEEVLKSCTKVMNATSELRFATTQDEIIDSAKSATNQTARLLKASYTLAVTRAPNPTVTTSIKQAAKQIAETMCVLLDESKKSHREESSSLQRMEDVSSQLTTNITNLITALRQLPESEKLVKIMEAGDDNEKKAESELTRCSLTIDDSMKEMIRAKDKNSKTQYENVNQKEINEALLTATSACAEATKKLVATAESAQKERVNASAPLKKQMKYNQDQTWANGLIEAAKFVSTSIQTLSKTANDTVDGKAKPDGLVTATQGIAQATAHLVAASKAKSNANTVKNLGLAAKLVANATAKLVEASNRAMLVEQEEKELSSVALNEDIRVKELEQYMKILKLENELEKYKRKLARLRLSRKKQ